MALNLLDSLSSPSNSTEKNPLSLKKKAEGEAGAGDFGDVLNGLMPAFSLQSLGLVPATQSRPEGQETVTGQEFATSGPDKTEALQAADGSALLASPLLPVMPPVVPVGTGMPTVPQPLTAVVLSPNMTAITPSQAQPDAGSLTAFAQSQGLDAEVAAWLMTAPHPTGAGASALAQVAAASGAREAGTVVPSPLDGAPASEGPEPATVLASLPVALPASWWTLRSQATTKAGTAAPASLATGADKPSVHNSILDLSQVFGDTPAPDKLGTAPLPAAPFTPAAWVMASVTDSPDTGATAPLKWLGDDTDSGRAPNDNLSPTGLERAGPSAKSGETGLAAPAKGFESAWSAAQRSELQQAQAEKMGQAIGQRMLSEMEKGHWHLKMMLRPANLGHIEVEMRLRNGELDAHFTVSQSATRDLLQDGLPKLRDTLTQMGMDVASMDIGSGSSPKNGGDPTPQRAQTFNASASKEAGVSEEQPVIQNKHVNTTGLDGLDVMV